MAKFFQARKGVCGKSFYMEKKKSQSKRLFSINKNKVCNKIPVSNIGKVISFISRGDKV